MVHPDNQRLLIEEQNDPTSFQPPPGYEKLFEQRKDESGRQIACFVKRRAELSGSHVKSAYVQPDNIGRPIVAFQLDSDGGRIFANTTRAHIHEQLAIVLDGELRSAPVINSEIPGGRGIIEGTFSQVEAQELASVLENPLQVPVKIVEERGVDPSLGKDSIHSGIKAALIGAVAVIVFMAAYYLFAGLVANIALVLNILILMGVMAALPYLIRGAGFALTLPGIAGIVLTIGMAVDANVLIYERIREELAANKSLRAAIVAGYQRAFVVIFDSNFTTIMTAVILIYLGSGPVQGFGVTLTIGLLANLFTAVFVTRAVFDWLVEKGWMKSFNILHVFRHLPHVNFLGVWKIAFAISWLIIIAGMFAFVRGGGLQVGKGKVYGIDFKGGDAVTMKYAKRVDEDALSKSLERGGFTDAYVQYQRNLAGGAEVLTLKLPEGTSDKVVTHLESEFPDAQFKVIGTERVGAIVGKELLNQALLAVGVALLAIMLYVAFRFGEMSYGLGALISLVHDILMTIGLFCLTGRTFSMPVVAAILTLIGYSINDTIVVFDRIRENKKLTGGKLSYFDLINRSVNETLSRTILTAGTVFLCAVSLYVFGGRVLNDFAFCFVIGVLTGTYSSIYIASPCVLWYHRKEENKAKATAKKTVPAKA